MDSSSSILGSPLSGHFLQASNSSFLSTSIVTDSDAGVEINNNNNNNNQYLRKRIFDLESDLSASRTEVSVLKGKLHDVTRESALMIHSLHEYKKQNYSPEPSTTHNYSNNANNIPSFARLRAELNSSRAELAAKNSELRQAHEVIGKMVKGDGLEVNIQDHLNCNNNNAFDDRLLHMRVASTERKLAEVLTSNELLENDLRNERELRGDMENRAITAEANAKRLEIEMDAATKSQQMKIALLRNQLEEVQRTSMSESNASNNSGNNNISMEEVYKHRLSKSESAVKILTYQLVELADQIQKSKDESKIEDVQTEEEKEKELEIAHLTSRCQQYLEELQQSKDKIATLRTLNASVTEECKESKNKLDELNERFQELLVAKQRRSNEDDVCDSCPNVDIMQFTSGVVNIKRENETLAAHLEVLKMKLEDCQTELRIERQKTRKEEIRMAALERAEQELLDAHEMVNVLAKRNNELEAILASREVDEAIILNNRKILVTSSPNSASNSPQQQQQPSYRSLQRENQELKQMVEGLKREKETWKQKAEDLGKVNKQGLEDQWRSVGHCQQLASKVRELEATRIALNNKITEEGRMVKELEQKLSEKEVRVEQDQQFRAQLEDELGKRHDAVDKMQKLQKHADLLHWENQQLNAELILKARKISALEEQIHRAQRLGWLTDSTMQSSTSSAWPPPEVIGRSKKDVNTWKSKKEKNEAISATLRRKNQEVDGFVCGWHPKKGSKKIVMNATTSTSLPSSPNKQQ